MAIFLFTNNLNRIPIFRINIVLKLAVTFQTVTLNWFNFFKVFCQEISNIRPIISSILTKFLLDNNILFLSNRNDLVFHFMSHQDAKFIYFEYSRFSNQVHTIFDFI